MLSIESRSEPSPESPESVYITRQPLGSSPWQWSRTHLTVHLNIPMQRSLVQSAVHINHPSALKRVAPVQEISISQQKGLGLVEAGET